MGSALEMYSYVDLFVTRNTGGVFFLHIIFFTDGNGNFDNRGIGDGLGS